MTEGATEAEALVEAKDCVIAALGGYVEGRHPIPAPSPVRGRATVALPVLVAAKIALYGTMHEQGGRLGRLTGHYRPTAVRGYDASQP